MCLNHYNVKKKVIKWFNIYFIMFCIEVNFMFKDRFKNYKTDQLFIVSLITNINNKLNMISEI